MRRAQWRGDEEEWRRKRSPSAPAISVDAALSALRRKQEKTSEEERREAPLKGRGMKRRRGRAEEETEIAPLLLLVLLWMRSIETASQKDGHVLLVRNTDLCRETPRRRL